MPTPIHYRNIKKYKYQLIETCSFETGIRPEKDIFEPNKPGRAYIYLSAGGRLTVFSGYAWDGPSGPTIDTKNYMRGSLVHDALYQLIRQRAISIDERLPADKLLRKMCRCDGMSPLRAWIVYKGVRWFGEEAAMPRDEPDVKIITVP